LARERGGVDGDTERGAALCGGMREREEKKGDCVGERGK
jgi:hypothetical protein